MKDISVSEDLLSLNTLLCDLYKFDANIIGEFARLFVQKYEKTRRLLRFHI